MTLVQLAYRMRLYKPRSEDAAETTVLTPSSGTVHSDNFQVATISGVSGYQPYLEDIRGRAGRLDLKTRRLDTGEFSFRILDKRVPAGGTNDKRWLTAFIGNTAGKFRLGGIRAEIDESTDGGTTWTRWMTGRVSKLAISQSRQWWNLSIRENTDELSARCFVATPYNVSYAQRPSLLPLGLVKAYGNNPITPPLKCEVTDSTGTRVEFTLDPDEARTLRATVTKYLLEQYRRVDNAIDRNNPTQFPPYLRCVATNVSSPNTGEFKVGSILSFTLHGVGQPISETVIGAGVVKVEELESVVPGYIGAGAFGNGNVATISLYADVPPSKENPIVLNDTHPVQIIKDLLDGKFGLLTKTGAVRQTFPYNSSNFTTFIADTTIPNKRFVITETEEDMREFIEKKILADSNLGWVVNASGEIEIVDLRPPQSVQVIGTITNQDLLDNPVPAWELDREGAITIVKLLYYVDRTVVPGTDLNLSGGGIPDTPAIRSTDNVLLIEDFGAIGDLDLGQKTLEIDAAGYRSLTNELTDGISRLEWIRKRLFDMAQELRVPFGRGPMTVRLECKRTGLGSVNARPGELRLVQVNELPDPATSLRGGTRLMRVLERSDDGVKIVLRLLDMGLNVVANNPTVATPAQEGGNTKHGITAAITLNAQSDPVRLQFATTLTSVGSRPATREYFYGQLVTSSSTATIRDLPAGRRIWVRARSEPSSPLKLPSPWVYPAGTEYVDLTALTAPSSPATSSITDKAALFTWTPGETTGVYTIITLETPAGGTKVIIQYLPNGSSRYQLVGLLPSTQYRVEVYYADGLGGVSSAVGSTFTTAGSGTVAGSLIGGRVYRGILVATA